MSDAFTLAVKAVPGARRDEVVGWLGDRLKIRISAPPEDGRANQAICRLLASELGIRPSAIAITRGGSSPEKTLTLAGITEAHILARWPRA
jgi:uncharacterized protein (TIGR00251 family)